MEFWKKGQILLDRGQDRAKRLLGRFEIECELGSGTTGTVYLGTDLASGRQVAVKTLCLADGDDAATQFAVRSRFLHEARVLAWLAHPDIVAVYDVGEEEGLIYIAMEFAQGVGLDAFSEPGKLLPLPTALEIVARVAEALGYAHEQNVTHCDVKPSNIIYDAATGNVKVTDFGIARMLRVAAPRTRTVIGSAPYMSPEQVMGKPVSGASDLFSLGSTLYKLLCGRLAFDADTTFDIFSRIVHDPHTDILWYRSDLPPCICKIIDRALSKKIEDRYASGYQMAEIIRECILALPVT